MQIFSVVAGGWQRIKLFVRRMHVYAVALYVRVQYERAEKRAGKSGLTKEEQDKIWDDVHTSVSKVVCKHILLLEGLWVKLGQYLSTRADVMPDIWISRLVELQDALPPRPFSQIQKTLTECFGPPPSKKRNQNAAESSSWPFQSIDPQALGTASIAQVHRAKLQDGEDVVIKVQHRGVEGVILQDLDNAMYFAEQVAKKRPKHDVRVFLQEWCNETRKEVDFLNEAENTERIARNLKNLQGVRLPRVIRKTVGNAVVEPFRKLLVLEFIDGVKPTDVHELTARGVGSERILERLSASFAQQIFVDGLFNGDPHPGNILIERSTGTPVLLDFGLVKEVPKETRIAFCRLLVSAAQKDLTGLLQALGEMGVAGHVSLRNPQEAMDAVHFAFRDAVPTTQQRHRGLQAKDTTNEEDEEEDSDDEEPKLREEAKSLDAYPVVVEAPSEPARTNQQVANRAVTRQEPHPVSRVAAPDSGSNAGPSERSTTGTNETLSKKSSATGKRYPAEATPGTVLFLLRVVSCLRGIAVSLGCGHSYLRTMAPFAQRALRVDVSAGPRSNPPAPRTELEATLQKKVQELCDRQMALGLQVVVLWRNKLEAQVAWGELGPVDPRPVKMDSLFCTFSCGKALTSLLVHVLCDRGWISSIDDPVMQYWPEFGCAGKEAISIRQILQHEAGLAHASPRFALKHGAGGLIRALGDFKRMCRWIAKARPDAKDLGVPTYHALTQGWLVAGLAEQVARKHTKRSDYKSLVADLVLRPLGIEEDVFVQIPEESITQEVSHVQARLASVALDPDLLAKDESNDIFTDIGGGFRSNDGIGQLGMDPRMFNDASIRAALLPAANTHFTAGALAVIYGALGGNGSLVHQGRVLSEEYCRNLQREIASYDGRSPWPCGFRRFQVVPDGDTASVGRAFGFVGLMNSIGYCDPEDGLSVAVVVNQLSENGDAAAELLSTVSSVLGTARHTLEGLGTRGWSQ